MYDKTCSQRLDEWAPQATPRPPPQRHCMPTVTPRERIKLPRRAVFFSCLHNPGRRLHSPAGYTMTDSGMQSAHVCTLPLSPAGALSDALTTTEHTPCNHGLVDTIGLRHQHRRYNRYSQPTRKGVRKGARITPPLASLHAGRYTQGANQPTPACSLLL
jgi:hypothetical protein